MKPHLELAHRTFEEIVAPEDIIIDATCGNGHDTLKLATLAPLGKIYALDLQESAIQNTKNRLADFENVSYFQNCHTQFPSEIEPKSVKLIVYNLGYLPGSDKMITTTVSTTRESLIKAMDLVMPLGWISIMCYPGHEEGKREEDDLIEFASKLDSKEWYCCHHRFVNRKGSPSLLQLQALITCQH